MRKVTAIILSVAVMSSSTEGLGLDCKAALRPLCSQLSPVTAIHFRRSDAGTTPQIFIDRQASLKKLTELLYKWNFKVYACSHQRIYLRTQGLKVTTPLIGVASVAREMEKKADSFKGACSDMAISRIKQAAEFLRKRKKSDISIPAPNEATANMLLLSVIKEVSGLKRQAKVERLAFELGKARVYYRNGKWYVRGQRYLSSHQWQTSVLVYKDCAYDTLWEAFRALDHQIDTGLEERSWLLGCILLIDRLTGASSAEKDELGRAIDSMLARLKRIKVEEKRLARILLLNAKVLLKSDRTGQAKDFFILAKDLFKERVSEIEKIIQKLQESRLGVLREETEGMYSFLMEKTAKILKNLGSKHYGLTRMIIDDNFINGIGARYITEPDFIAFRKAFVMLSELFQRRLDCENPRPLSDEEIKRLEVFFSLFRDRIVSSRLKADFTADCRDSYMKEALGPEGIKATREECFEHTFEKYLKERRAVQERPQLCKLLFYQALFVSPKIRGLLGREDNPEFLLLADTIMEAQAEKIGIKEGGLEILLRAKNPPPKPSSAGQEKNRPNIRRFTPLEEKAQRNPRTVTPGEMDTLWLTQAQRRILLEKEISALPYAQSEKETVYNLALYALTLKSLQEAQAAGDPEILAGAIKIAKQALNQLKPSSLVQNIQAEERYRLLQEAIDRAEAIEKKGLPSSFGPRDENSSTAGKALSAGSDVGILMDRVEEVFNSSYIGMTTYAGYVLYGFLASGPESTLGESLTDVLSGGIIREPETGPYWLQQHRRAKEILRNGLYSENLATKVAAAYFKFLLFLIPSQNESPRLLTDADHALLLEIVKEGLYSDDYSISAESTFILLWLGAIREVFRKEEAVSGFELPEELKELSNLFSYENGDRRNTKLAAAEAFVSFLHSADSMTDTVLTIDELQEEQAMTYAEKLIAELLAPVVRILRQIIQEDQELSDAKRDALITLHMLIGLRIANRVSRELEEDDVQENLEALMAQQAKELWDAIQQDRQELSALEIAGVNKKRIEFLRSRIGRYAATYVRIAEAIGPDVMDEMYRLLEVKMSELTRRLMEERDEKRRYQALQELKFLEEAIKRTTIYDIGLAVSTLKNNIKESANNLCLRIYSAYLLAGFMPDILWDDKEMRRCVAEIFNEGIRSDNPAIATLSAHTAILLAGYVYNNGPDTEPPQSTPIPIDFIGKSYNTINTQA